MRSGTVSSLSILTSWDLWVTACVTASALFIPFSLVLGTVNPSARLALDVVITLTLVADAVLRWRGGLRRELPHEESGNPAGDSPAGTLVDVIAAVPWFLLPVAPGLQLLRLAKLFRVFQLQAEMRNHAFSGMVAVQFGSFFYVLTLTAHWIACGWIRLRAATVTDRWDTYLDGLYWCVTTLTTVGYGDIVPETHAEKIYSIGVILLGATFWGFLVGNVARVLVNLDPVRARYLERMEDRKAFMRHRRLPRELERRVRDHFRYLWHQRRDHDEAEILDHLPPSLRTEVALHLRRDLIEAVPLLKGSGRDFVRDVALAMKPLVVLPGDVITRAGERGRAMYFISAGTVEVTSAEGEVLNRLQKGDFFGEMALIFDQPRNATIRAVGYCDLYRLERDTFGVVLSHYPEVARQIEATARERG